MAVQRLQGQAAEGKDTDTCPLNTHATYALLASVFLCAEILQSLPDHGPLGNLLVVITRDAERRIAQVFGQINALHPGIEVVLPDCDEEIAHLFL